MDCNVDEINTCLTQVSFGHGVYIIALGKQTLIPILFLIFSHLDYSQIVKALKLFYKSFVILLQLATCM